MRDTGIMAGVKVGYARVSTVEQDLAVQREALLRLGVTEDRIYVDHGLTGAHRSRPGLREAMAACWPGDTLVATKLDRLARSMPATSPTSSPPRAWCSRWAAASTTPPTRWAGCCSTC